MDVEWDYELVGDQRSYPVVHSEYVDLPDSIQFPSDEEIAKVFPNKGYILQTWGRRRDLKTGRIQREHDPHWIGIRNGTTLHTDPAYPRYSHHLKLRVDGDVIVRGLDKRELQLKRGLFYILDAQSPHQVVSKTEKDTWNIAVSIDSSYPLDPVQALRACKLYARSVPFLVGYVDD